MIIIGIVFFLNMLLLRFACPTIEELIIFGWMMLGIGALFVVLSVLTLHRMGISKITDNGVYGIVRHPMYLGGLIMFFSHVFFGQNWMTVLNTIIGVICCYLIILSGDQRNIEKFGDEYRRYMQKVPRMNFVVGVFRLARRRKK